MKKLTILRHAKAEPPENYPGDSVRPLTKRGEKDAALIATFLTQLDPLVDWVLSSPALRAEQTAKIVAKHFSGIAPVIYDEQIYEADAGLLLTLLRSIPPEQEHALLVGHNPSLESLVAGLCSGAPGSLECRLTTAGMAHIHVEIMRWDQIRWGAGVLQLLVQPRVLRKR
jgi:phosphohistidine phosphatase